MLGKLLFLGVKFCAALIIVISGVFTVMVVQARVDEFTGPVVETLQELNVLEEAP